MEFWMAITIMLTWVNFITWLSFFENTAHYVRMIIVTFKDISNFLIVQMMFVFTFGFTIYFLNIERQSAILTATEQGIVIDENDPQYAELFPTHTGLGIFDTIFHQYMLLLGEFEADGYEAGKYGTFVWVLFILATFMSQVMIFNMLIAIMSDSYNKVEGTRESSGLK